MVAEEFCSVKFVLERFHNKKFRETQQEVIVSLLEETDRQTDRQPLFKHDKLKSCAACGVVRKY